MESYPEYLSMIHRAALKIAGKGKPVFPCKLNKSPCTPRGFKDATTDPAKVTALWTRYGGEKIGMPTGSHSGVFVFDVDRLEAIEELPPELREEMDQTLTVRTPSGGLHFYFKHVDGITNRTGALPDGIDIRGEGGYVIAYPSPGYTIERRAPTADAPAGLIALLKDEPRSSGTRRRQSEPRASFVDDGEPIPDGRRNETLASIAGRLHDGTRDPDQLEDDLLDVNKARCIPPLPREQVRRIARSIYRYEPCRPPRREPDPETVQELARAERIILSGEWKGKGGKTRYSLSVAWLKLARRHATRVEDGVRLEVSWRQLALAAGVSRPTAMKGIKDMPDMFRVDNEGAESGKSGAIVFLLTPARIFTTLPTDSVSRGCKDSRVPFTAPRLRWSSPARKSRRGVTPGTRKVRDSIVSKKRDAILRLGKACELVMDSVEAAGGTKALPELAAAIGVKRPRDLTRRRNPETGKGRDGFVTRLENIGVLEVFGDTVTLTENWLEALDRERDRAGEIELYQRDMRRYNRESKAYRDREKVKADPAPSKGICGRLGRATPSAGARL